MTLIPWKDAEQIAAAIEQEREEIKAALSAYGMSGKNTTLRLYDLIAAVVDDRIERLVDRIEAAKNVRP